MRKEKSIIVRMSAELKERLDNRRNKESSVSEFIREAIRERLDKEDKE